MVVPALDAGTWVVTDRYAASTSAYQGFGRGIDRGELATLIEWATRGLAPDLTVLIDVPAETAADRRGRGAGDRFEAQGITFQQRVADGYRLLAAEEATSWLVIDGAPGAEAVAEAVWSGVTATLGEGPGRG